MERSNIITWILTCGSQESLRRAKQIAKRESNLNKTFIDIAIAFPNGVEERITEHHRLGDYFDRVQVLADDSLDAKSFMLVFQPRQGAGRYWKDLMARILGSIHDSVADVLVEIVPRARSF